MYVSILLYVYFNWKTITEEIYVHKVYVKTQVRNERSSLSRHKRKWTIINNNNRMYTLSLCHRWRYVFFYIYIFRRIIRRYIAYKCRFLKWVNRIFEIILCLFIYFIFFKSIKTGLNRSHLWHYYGDR